jgi:hypothetical protein
VPAAGARVSPVPGDINIIPISTVREAIRVGLVG